MTVPNTGNFGKLFERHQWDFINSLGTDYNSVVKMAGPLGVC